jgi:DNA-binding beta-propeller fold protein YncE
MPPEFDRRAGMDEASDRFWDQASQGRAHAAGDLDPADAATIRYLHSHDDRPAPNPAFIRQLREELMHAHVIQVSSSPSGVPLPNGRASRVCCIGAHALPASSRQRALAQLATAALLLLVLASSLLVFGPGRLTPPQEQHVVMPAISSTPATPDAGRPIAEFLWQVDGGPDFPIGSAGIPAIDPQGNLWVADGDNGRFVIFSPDGAVLEAWGAPGNAEGEFDFACPAGLRFGAVAFDRSGNFYVADSGNQRIQKFGPDRSFITSWGSEGTDDDQFLCPAALAIDGQGRVYVSDEGWGRVKVFDGEGAWLATWSGLTSPIGLTADAEDNIWVADMGAGIVKFSADGERLATWKGGYTRDATYPVPLGIAVDAQGRVFAADYDGHRILVFAPDGTKIGEWGERGSGSGAFRSPFGLVLDGKGAVYVADEATPVQKFRLLPPFGPEGDPATSDMSATPETSSAPLADLLRQAANAGDVPLA